MVGNKCEIMCSIPCIYVFLTFSITSSVPFYLSPASLKMN
jgi:hypothetical protein